MIIIQALQPTAGAVAVFSNFIAAVAPAAAERGRYPTMGYDVHITRKEDWSDEDGPAISETEWRRLIEDDPELQLDTETQCTMSDGEYVFAAWNGEPGALGHYNGEITAKNPSEALIRKMTAIAQRLNAKVQGDDGEHYPEALDSWPKQKPSFWRRLFGGG